MRYEAGVQVLHEKGSSSSHRRLKTRYEFYRAMARFYKNISRLDGILSLTWPCSLLYLRWLTAGLGKEIVRYAARYASEMTLIPNRDFLAGAL